MPTTFVNTRTGREYTLPDDPPDGEAALGEGEGIVGRDDQWDHVKRTMARSKRWRRGGSSDGGDPRRVKSGAVPRAFIDYGDGRGPVEVPVADVQTANGAVSQIPGANAAVTVDPTDDSPAVEQPFTVEVDESREAGGDAGPPAVADNKDAWIDYAVKRGLPRGEAEGLRKSELVDRYSA